MAATSYSNVSTGSITSYSSVSTGSITSYSVLQQDQLQAILM